MLENNKLLAQLGLLITSLIWGATFLVVKDALHPEEFPPLLFGGIRFILAAFCIYAFVEIKLIRKEFFGPAVCGLVLFIGYAFQNYGLIETTPTKSAFITSVSVLMVPLLLFIFRMDKISIRIWISVAIAFLGIQMIGDDGFKFGDILTFGCAISFAIHIIIQDKLNKDKVFNFFFIQSFVAGVLSLLASLCIDDMNKFIPTDAAMIGILITGVLGTTVALLVMIWAQKILSASETAIIIAMEPVFAVVFSVYFGYEPNGLEQISYLGCFLVIAAIVYCELTRSTN